MPEKLVCDYARISFSAIGDLLVDEYQLLLRDAVIYRLEQTEDGRKRLEKCWILEQTEPDRKRLRDKFGQ